MLEQFRICVERGKIALIYWNKQIVYLSQFLSLFDLQRKILHNFSLFELQSIESKLQRLISTDLTLLITYFCDGIQ